MTEEEKVQTGEMESKIMDELASQKSTDATSQEISELSKKGYLLLKENKVQEAIDACNSGKQQLCTGRPW